MKAGAAGSGSSDGKDEPMLGTASCSLPSFAMLASMMGKPRCSAAERAAEIGIAQHQHGLRTQREHTSFDFGYGQFRIDRHSGGRAGDRNDGPSRVRTVGDGDGNSGIATKSGVAQGSTNSIDLV